MADNEFHGILEEFPSYTISNYGTVTNSYGQIMTHSRTAHGEHTVGLMRNGRQYRRSVKVLVARAFVDGETEIFDTPILLDGDRGNLHTSNLAWRPRWFALAYQKQFDQIEDWWYAGPVVDDAQGITYEDIFSAAMETGSLVRHIRLGMLNRERVFPTGALFRFS